MRRTTTILTALGIALPVAVLIAALAMIDGLHSAFASTSDSRNVLVLRKGATSELSSNLTNDIYRQILYQPGVATVDNAPLVSLELVTVVTLSSKNGAKGFPVTLRGISPAGIQLHDVKLLEGRWFQSGQQELVVGRSITRRAASARVGDDIRIGNSNWHVVGIMDAGHSAFNSELFADANQVSGDFNRRDQFSSITVRASDASSVPTLISALNDNPRLNVNAQSETSYYALQTASGASLERLGIFVALIMSVGSCFAAMNTMYATVSRRAREIGILRVLGFSKNSILASFLAESLVLAGVGGLAGCLFSLPLNLVTTAVGNFTTMSETSFRFHAGIPILLTGLVFALVVGAIGGVFPARLAARKEILSALREV